MVWKKFAWHLVLLPILASCAHVAEQQTDNTWRPMRVADVRLAAEGRISVVYRGQGLSVSFEWNKTAAVENLDVALPLGITVGQLCVDGQGAVLKLVGKPLAEQKSARDLGRQMLGTEIPFEYLSVWASGGRVDGIPYRVAADGVLEQDGWRVRRAIDEDGQLRLLEVSKAQAVMKMAFQSFAPSAENADMAQCALRSGQ